MLFPHFCKIITWFFCFYSINLIIFIGWDNFAPLNNPSPMMAYITLSCMLLWLVFRGFVWVFASALTWEISPYVIFPSHAVHVCHSDIKLSFFTSSGKTCVRLAWFFSNHVRICRWIIQGLEFFFFTFLELFFLEDFDELLNVLNSYRIFLEERLLMRHWSVFLTGMSESSLLHVLAHATKIKLFTVVLWLGPKHGVLASFDCL